MYLLIQFCYSFRIEWNTYVRSRIGKRHKLLIGITILFFFLNLIKISILIFEIMHHLTKTHFNIMEIIFEFYLLSNY